MATHGDIGLSQPAASTITMKLRTVTQDLNSTTVHQEVMTIGGAESSLQVAQVLGATPASTTMGLVVRLPAPVTDSTLNALRAFVVDSTGLKIADRDNSSQVAAVLNATPASTTYGLAVRPVGGGVDYTHDGAVTLSTVAGPSVMFVAHSSYGSAVSADNDIVVGLADRRGRQQVTLSAIHSSINNYAASTAGQSTLTVVAAATSGLKNRVFALSVTSTSMTQGRVGFYAGTAAKWLTRWSSAVMGFNIAVTPPAYLFETAANEAVNFQVESTADFSVNVGYFLEP